MGVGVGVVMPPPEMPFRILMSMVTISTILRKLFTTCYVGVSERGVYVSLGTYKAIVDCGGSEGDFHSGGVGVVGEAGDLVDGHGDITGSDVGLAGNEGGGLGGQGGGCESEDVEVHFGQSGC